MKSFASSSAVWITKDEVFLRPTLSLLIVAAMVPGFQLTSSAEEMKTLTVSDVAPALDIEHWVQDNDGKLAPVKEFEKGKVYVVEFWAAGPIMMLPMDAEGFDKKDLVAFAVKKAFRRGSVYREKQ